MMHADNMACKRRFDAPFSFSSIVHYGMHIPMVYHDCSN